MGFHQLQDCSSHSSFTRSRIQTHSPMAMGVILAAHVIVITFVLNEKARHRELLPERVLHMINLPPQQEKRLPIPQLPDLKKIIPLPLTIPTIQFSEAATSPLASPPNESSYSTSGQYSTVFDPKMRQKLLDSQGINRLRAQEKSRTWTAIDGRTFIEMGDGICMVSMAKVDSRDRANNWGYTTCGKNDSEKAMERVMADFESRKTPLGKLKSNP